MRSRSSPATSASWRAAVNDSSSRPDPGPDVSARSTRWLPAMRRMSSMRPSKRWSVKRASNSSLRWPIIGANWAANTSGATSVGPGMKRRWRCSVAGASCCVRVKSGSFMVQSFSHGGRRHAECAAGQAAKFDVRHCATAPREGANQGQHIVTVTLDGASTLAASRAQPSRTQQGALPMLACASHWSTWTRQPVTLTSATHASPSTGCPRIARMVCRLECPMLYCAAHGKCRSNVVFSQVC